MKRPINLYILIIVLFALALRLIYFFGILEGDDVEYVDRAYYLSQHGLAGLKELDDLPGSNRPGQYIPTAVIFKLFGVSELSTALFPLLASLITCYLLYRIGRLLINEQAGLMSAFLWAVFPLNIFLATQLDPEGPLTMATTGAMYSLMLSNTKDRPIKKFGLYFVSLVLIGWAYLIKQSALPIVFAAAAWFYWSYARTAEMRSELTSRLSKKTLSYILGIGFALLLTFLIVYLLKQPWDKSINSAELTATDISQTLILGRMNPIRWQELGNKYYFNLNREIYTPVPAPNSLASYPETLQFTLFDAFTPILLLSLIFLSITKKHKAYFFMVWLAVVFFYIEWGPYPRNLRQIFYYLPVSHWISPDNLLYICIPLILVIGTFLSTQLSNSATKRTLLFSIPSTLLAVGFLENSTTSSITTSMLSTLLVGIFCFGLIGPEILHKFRAQNAARLTLYTLLMIAVGISSLNHALHYHISFFESFIQRRENLKAAHEYLLVEPAYPILYVGNGLAGWMNIYSGYRYSPPLFTRPTYPETRLTDDIQVLRQNGGFLLGEGCGKPASSLETWPWIEFGDPSSSACVSMFRIIPESELRVAFAQAQNQVEKQPTKENLLNYIALAASADNLHAFIDGLSEMATRYPEDTPILQASGIVIGEQAKNSDHVTLDLLSNDRQILEDWELGPLLSLSSSEVGGQKILTITIDGSTEEIQTVRVPLVLKERTAYVLDIEFTSFAPASLVSFSSPFIPDSSKETWSRELDWTNLQIAFVTPSFTEATNAVWLELAQVYDKGDISFRRLNLIEIGYDD